MKISSRLVWIFATVTLFAAPLARGAEAAAAPTTPAAPTHRRIDEIRERRMKQLDGALSLTPEQQARINAIWDKAEKDVGDAAKAQRLQQRSHRREVLKATRADVRAVLTPEQQQKFDVLPVGRGARDGETATPKTK